MPTCYRVIRRTQHGSEVIAEISDGLISGPSADLVRERLYHFGYPRLSIEEALQRFRCSAPSYIGFERLPSNEG